MAELLPPLRYSETNKPSPQARARLLRRIRMKLAAYIEANAGSAKPAVYDVRAAQYLLDATEPGAPTAPTAPLARRARTYGLHKRTVPPHPVVIPGTTGEWATRHYVDAVAWDARIYVSLRNGLANKWQIEHQPKGFGASTRALAISVFGRPKDDRGKEDKRIQTANENHIKTWREDDRSGLYRVCFWLCVCNLAVVPGFAVAHETPKSARIKPALKYAVTWQKPPQALRPINLLNPVRSTR